MIASFLSGKWGPGRLCAVVIVAVTVMGCGSDSSGPGVEGSTRKGAVKEEDLYKYVGEGAGKKKVGLTIDERRRARGAAKAQGSN